MWRDQFDWVYREYDYAVFPITVHPDVSGRPHVLMMLERLYQHMMSHPGVRFLTMNEMADDFRPPFAAAAVTRSAAGMTIDVRTVRRSGRSGALDRRRRPTGVFTRNIDAASRRRERVSQVAAANRVLKHYRVSLADWQATAFVLSTATGKAEIVDNLGHLWTVAERPTGNRAIR